MFVAPDLTLSDLLLGTIQNAGGLLTHTVVSRYAEFTTRSGV
jgi:hypothetical protein